MSWQDVALTVTKYAPFISGALAATGVGAPIAGGISLGASLLSSFLGVEPEPDKVLAAFNTAKADPAQMVELARIDSENQKTLSQERVSLLALAVANVENARNREVSLAKMGHKGAWATHVVSAIVTIGFFVMLYYVLNPEVVASKTVEPSQAAVLLLGSLATAFGAVVNYYVGSSLGSKDKDASIDRIAANGGKK